MMNQPVAGRSPESILPPSIEADLRYLPKYKGKLTDLAVRGVKMLFIDFATDREAREEAPKMHFPIADYSDDVRPHIARAFRDTSNHVFDLNGIKYVVKVTDCGRHGFLLECVSSSPSSPASKT